MGFGREPASPGRRLTAWVIDFLVYSLAVVSTQVALLFGVSIELVYLPLFIFSSFVPWALLFVVLSVVFTIQLVLLARCGQTVGKMMVKIRVVDAQTGAKPHRARLVLLRPVVTWFILTWIFINPIALVSIGVYVEPTTLLLGIAVACAYWLASSLFVFRADHRTT